jgi:uncharacterized membrane protein YhaH (DUF805 family)
MLAAIRHGLGNLLNFNGRDARQAFWYYVLFVYLVTVAVALVVVIPMTINAVAIAVQQGIAAGQSGNPEAAQLQAQAAIMRSMSGTMSGMLTVSMVTNALMLALLAAAFVRRLHDSNVSGFWALLPGVIHVVNLVLAPSLVRGMMENMGRMAPGDPTAGFRAMQGSMGAASVFGWVAIIVVIVLGVRKSTPGPNRYGDAPFTA